MFRHFFGEIRWCDAHAVMSGRSMPCRHAYCWQAIRWLANSSRSPAAVTRKRDAVDGVHSQGEPVGLVPDRQFQRRVDVAVLLVAAHVEVVLTRPDCGAAYGGSSVAGRPNCFRQAKTGRSPKRGAALMFTETKRPPAVQRARGRLVVTQYNASFSTERRRGVGG